MKTISLLPPEIRAQELAQSRGEKILGYGFLVGIVFVFVWLALGLATWMVNISANRVAEQRILVENECSKYQVYADLLNEINNARSLAQQAVGVPTDWSENLQNINRYIPANVWLTEFMVNRTELDVKGNALDPTSVARWVETIKDVPGINDVRCQFARDEKNDLISGSAFEIKSGFSPGEAPQIKSEEGV